MVAENPTWGAPRIHGQLLKRVSISRKCAAMGSASPERSRSHEAMADVPQESSRGNGCDGLLYNPNAHVWFLYCFFVIGHDRSKILHFNSDAKSQCSLDCAAIRRRVGLQTAAPILAVRPRLNVWSRCGFGGGTSEASPPVRPFTVLGRTVLPNARLEVSKRLA